jgi:hypothetical protein
VKKIIFLFGYLMTTSTLIVASNPIESKDEMVFRIRERVHTLQEEETRGICSGLREITLAESAEKYQEDCYMKKEQLSIQEFEDYFFRNHFMKFSDENKKKIVNSKKLTQAIIHCHTYRDLQLDADKRFVRVLAGRIVVGTVIVTDIALSYMLSNE